MKIEEQVITKAQAKKLYDLGVEQKSIFYWNQVMYKEEESLHVEKGHWNICYREAPSGEIISAFTVSELGEMLPEYIGEYFLEMYKDSSNNENKEWFLVRYTDYGFGIDNADVKIAFNMSNEAQARAEMLIYLLENKLIK